ncbi:MAG: hypothetical protein AB1782_16145 [Cyanobacteriota bacterium]
MQYNKGQEAIEFILITTLVFFGSLMVVLVFGNKIANFFTNDSSAVKAANASPTVIGVSDNQKYNPDYTTTDNNKTSYQTAAEEAAATAAAAVASAQKTSSGGTPFTLNTDGSVSFSVAGQNVMLSSDIVQLQDIVMETSGSEGATSLVDEIAYMINKYKAEFPDSNVPVEVSFGKGDRYWNSYDTSISYAGDAEVNTVTLKLGNSFVVIQKDQTCVAHDQSCAFQGTYRIEGTIDKSNNFTANVTSTNTDYNPYGTLSGSVSNIGNLTLNGTYWQYDDKNFKAVDYSWKLSFDTTGSSFSL